MYEEIKYGDADLDMHSERFTDLFLKVYDRLTSPEDVDTMKALWKEVDYIVAHYAMPYALTLERRKQE